MAVVKNEVRKLRVTMAVAGADGKEAKRSRTFANVTKQATENSCYDAGMAIAGLLDGNPAAVVQLVEKELAPSA